MSTNTADLTHYHPETPSRSLDDYADILQCERPKSSHPMSLTDRAAQFSPYAALTGHHDIIAENEDCASHKINIDTEVNLIPDEDANIDDFIPNENPSSHPSGFDEDFDENLYS